MNKIKAAGYFFMMVTTIYFSLLTIWLLMLGWREPLDDSVELTKKFYRTGLSYWD